MPIFPEVFREIFEPVFCAVGTGRKVGIKIIQVATAVFVLALLFTLAPEDQSGAKVGLVSAGRWQEVPATNSGPFLTPMPGADGWNGWGLTDTLDEWLLLNRELHYISGGQYRREQLDCRSPQIRGSWQRKGLRKLLLGCKAWDSAGAQSYFLVFRSQDEGLALESFEAQR